MENGGRGSHPIPQTGAKPFLTGADQGLEGKDRVGGYNRRKGFVTQPPKLPSKALRLCLGDLACGPEPPDPQLCKGRRAGAGWLSSPQQVVPGRGLGKPLLGRGRCWSHCWGWPWDSPKSCQVHDLTGKGAAGPSPARLGLPGPPIGLCHRPAWLKPEPETDPRPSQPVMS